MFTGTDQMFLANDAKNLVTGLLVWVHIYFELEFCKETFLAVARSTHFLNSQINDKIVTGFSRAFPLQLFRYNWVRCKLFSALSETKLWRMRTVWNCFANHFRVAFEKWFASCLTLKTKNVLSFVFYGLPLWNISRYLIALLHIHMCYYVYVISCNQ